MKTLLIVLIISVQLITNIFSQKKPEFYIENEPKSLILLKTEESFSLQFIKWGISVNDVISIIKEKYPNIYSQYRNKIILSLDIKPYKETIEFHFQNDKLFCIIDHFENDMWSGNTKKIVLDRIQYLNEKYISLFGKPDKENGQKLGLKNEDFSSYYASACWNAKPDREYYPETYLTITFNSTGSGNYVQSTLEYILIDNNNEPVELKLMRAIRYSNIDIIKDLLTQEIDYNFKYIYPPLEEKGIDEIVINSGSTEIVELLIDGGWNFNKKNDDGYTPLELAIEVNKDGIAEILKRNNAKGGSTFFNQGIVMYKKRNYNEALNLFEKAIRCDSRNSDYFEYKAHCYYYIKEYTKAISEYTKTITIDSSRIAAIKFRGLSYYQLNDYSSAYEDFATYLKTNDDSLLYLLSGVINYRNEEYQNALYDFQKATELDSNNPQCFKNRGDTYAKLGNNDLAIQDWGKALELGYKDKQKLEYMINKLKNEE